MVVAEKIPLLEFVLGFLLPEYAPLWSKPSLLGPVSIGSGLIELVLVLFYSLLLYVTGFSTLVMLVYYCMLLVVLRLLCRLLKFDSCEA